MTLNTDDLTDGFLRFGGTCGSNIHDRSVNVSSIPTTDVTDYFETLVSIKITGYRIIGDNNDKQVTQFLMVALTGTMNMM